MSTYGDITPDPRQGLRSPLGTPPGTPGPLGVAAPEPPPGLDLAALAGAPPGAIEVPPIPPAGGDHEVTLLRSMITFGMDYLDLDSVDESERLQMQKALTVLQRLLAANEKLFDQATGSSAQARKLGVG